MKSIMDALGFPSDEEHEARKARLLAKFSLPSPQTAEAIVAHEKREEENARRFRLERARVPMDVRDLLLNGELDKCAAASAVNEFLAIAPRKKMLVLAGLPGTGKTVAACIALRERGGLFTRAFEVADAAFEKEVAREIREAWPVLVLDDIGLEFANGPVLTAIDKIITWRYDKNYLTILTTNLTAEALKLRYEGRVATRLEHRGVFFELAAGEKCFRARDID